MAERRQYTARVRCTVTKEVVIEAESLEEASAKAEEWDVIDEWELDTWDFKVLSVKEG